MISSDLGTILQRTQDIARDVAAPHAAVVDREARWPEATIRGLQAAGLGGLVVPISCGGLGHGLLAVAQVCEILGHSCASTALCFGMHCVGTAVLAAKATEDHQQRYLVPIARGQHLTTLALSEAGSGAHFYLPQTELEQVTPALFRVTGTKSFVTNGGYADSYVVSTVAADPGAPPGQFSCVVIPRDTSGVSWGEPWTGLGMRGNAARTMDLRAVSVPRHDLLGREGDQLWYVFTVIAPYFLMAMAGTYLGIAGAALEEARQHLLQRRYTHSGAVLARQPILQHRLGTLWALVERTRQLVYYAAAEGDRGGVNALPAMLSAKAEVADCAVTVTNEAMTLMGGVAYREGGTMHRHLRDARAAHVMAPTTDVLRTWTGRALLDQPLLGD